MKPFSEQFRECRAAGHHAETEFASFKDHPELMPAFPNQKMADALENGKWGGIHLMLCGKFRNGRCSSSNPLCRKLRGLE